MAALIAFDTATERLVVGLAIGERSWLHESAGGARASASLLPIVIDLVAAAGIGLADLDAIGFGRGPGGFTGLRTAASVAQGLALGLGKPVLPLDSLLIVAAGARASFLAAGGAGDAPYDVWVTVDARMDEIYAAEYRHDDGHWSTLRPPMLVGCAALHRLWAEVAPTQVAGDALRVFAGRLVPPVAASAASALPAAGAMAVHDEARPSAPALLDLARQAWMAGAAVDAAEALPLYVRDRVAATMAEREAARRAAAADRAGAPPAALAMRSPPP